MARSLFDPPALDPRRLRTRDIKFRSSRVLELTHRPAHRDIQLKPWAILDWTRVMLGDDFLRMLENSQHLHAGLTSTLSLGHKKHHCRTVISCLQERDYIACAGFARHLRVIQVQSILDSAMIIDEVCECSEPPVFTSLVPLPASVICPLTTGFSYLLMIYGKADQTSQHDSG
jgi:hypothetical protein